MKVSIVIRTYNEARHLGALLEGIRSQSAPGLDAEVIVVDSGSTDETLSIAERFGCRIEHIRREDFSFGRSLNLGCRSASGDVLVMVSGHCIPVNENWVANLVGALVDNKLALVYGRQVGNESSHFSECRIFEKYYPDISSLPQEGFFCNNANLAIRRSTWQQSPFDESLTGLEDMHLAKQLTAKGMFIGYAANAAVYHLHHETWAHIRNRFEREAIALQYIMPELHLTFVDFVRYTASSVLFDIFAAIKAGKCWKLMPGIVRYRIAQYWGSYRGNHYHRKLSHERKERYFYPR